MNNKNCCASRLQAVDQPNRVNKSLTNLQCISSMFFVLAESYKLLRTRSACNKRELFYKNQPQLTTYRRLNDAVSNACQLLNCAAWELGILSSSKALISGPIRIRTDRSETIEFVHSEGLSLPCDFDSQNTIETTAKFVLVVEKETVFKRLLKDDIFNRLGQEFILITAKGQSDMSTRLFLNRIAAQFRIPIYGLFDADPYGIEIMLTYKFGSLVSVMGAAAGVEGERYDWRPNDFLFLCTENDEKIGGISSAIH